MSEKTINQLVAIHIYILFVSDITHSNIPYESTLKLHVTLLVSLTLFPSNIIRQFPVLN